MSVTCKGVSADQRIRRGKWYVPGASSCLAAIVLAFCNWIVNLHGLIRQLPRCRFKLVVNNAARS